MSDQTPDPALAADTPEPGDAALAGTVFEKPVDPATVKPFDFDELLSEGRLVERHAVICLRGDLEAEWVSLIEELSGLVDDNGEPVSADGEEASLGDTRRVGEINARLAELHKERLAASRRITFRAMPADEFETWDASHRSSNGDLKNQKVYFEQLISKCSQPPLSVEQVRAMRSTKLTKNQMVTLANTAYWANTTGGVDVPKLPGFSHGPTQPESSLS